MTVKFIASTVCLSLGALLTISCGQKTEADLIAEAQLCLDKSSSSTAQSCAAKLQGLTSAQSNIIRCSADFIQEGFDSPVKLVDALNQVTGSNPSTSSLLSALVFTTKPTSNASATNVSNYADQTFTYCQDSGQKGLTMIAMLAKSATQLAGLAQNASLAGIDFSNPSSITATNITTAMNSLASDATTRTAVGSTVQSAYTATCATGSQANANICGIINSAATSAGINLTTASADTIGNALLTYWQNH